MQKVFTTLLVVVSFLLFIIGCSNPTILENKSSLGEEQQTLSTDVIEKNNAGSVYNGYGSNVMLQGFGWDSAGNTTGWYNVVNSKSATIKQYFEWVWFPPPTDSGSTQGYLPRQLNVLNSSYGTEQQLKDAITAISPAKAIADIVINHRVGLTNWADLKNPDWGTDGICGDDEYFYAGNPGANVYPRGQNDVAGGQYGAARDIDHSNATVKSSIKTWMNTRLRSVGFVGWRYDYVKGYPGWNVGDYNAATAPELSVGELWEDGCPQNGLDAWVTATNHDGGKSLVFDFSTKNNLNNAFGWFKDAYDNGQHLTEYTYYNNYPNLSVLKSSYGTPSGYIGWHPENSITFVDNHDTGSTQQHWELRNDKVGLAYVYTLTHPGLPCVAWDHFFDWGTMQQHIIDLINIRKQNNITMTSTVTIALANYNEYAAVIDGKIAVKIGPGSSYNPGSGWVIIKSGTDYCIWKKNTDTTPPTVSVTAPANNATVLGTVTVSANASDNVGVTKVEFYVGSTLTNTDTTSPYSFSWNTTTTANGSNVVKAKAYDAAGNSTEASVTVNVNNGSTGRVRTVVFMQKETVSGQDIFVKGGHDAGLVPTYYPSMSEPIVYNNTKNTTTAAIKANDGSLDWGSESALDWTCKPGTSSYHDTNNITYANSGYGVDPENLWGMHYWKLDVDMYGAKGEWFEFKAFMRQGTTEWWENNITQTGTPQATINHWGKKGYITQCAYGANWANFTALP
ncbi:MAG: hypothetical protein A2086_11780 [Spirochaetes bacterium GWD1_27_9]|nr:MAG: hypothetical protein A2Z98_07240 [Spirochaetes bacterium GWB1_27_13]OHD28641.1 MAG: hypothetical protein A2086_11780 [Spirochaetes bacterium GWD1_27_9]